MCTCVQGNNGKATNQAADQECMFCATKIVSRRFTGSLDVTAGAAWSVSDPWTFASLSYDGRLVVNQVPSHTKYKILI